MAEASAFPYRTNVNIAFEALSDIDAARLVDAVTVPWYNQTLCKVNDSVVRLGVVKGEYRWHEHDDEDEFFCIVPTGD